jgi:hypothetical protein
LFHTHFIKKLKDGTAKHIYKGIGMLC